MTTTLPPADSPPPTSTPTTPPSTHITGALRGYLPSSRVGAPPAPPPDPEEAKLRRVRVYPSVGMFQIAAGGLDIRFMDIREGMLFTLKEPPGTPLEKALEDGTDLYLALSDAWVAPGADPLTATVDTDMACSWVEARKANPIRIYRYDTEEAWAAATVSPVLGGHRVRGVDLRDGDLFVVLDPLHARHGAEEGTDDGNTLRRWVGEALPPTAADMHVLQPAVSVIVAQRAPPG